MISAVLDTNTLASGFVGYRRAESAPGELLRRWRAKVFALVVSQHILSELVRTFADPYFTQRLTPQEIQAALAMLQADAILTPVTVHVAGVATTPKDDLVLATAESAGVDYLVTGDKKLLQLRRHRSITILSPRAFLSVLEQADAAP